MHDDIKGSIVIISHQERILNISDVIILLSGGRVAVYGPKEELFNKVVKESACYKLQGGDN